MTITEYRKSLGLSQEAFGALFGIRSKGYVSEMEKENRCSPEIALAIEEHSDHSVNAGDVNSIIARARGITRTHGTDPAESEAA
ncbi:MAG: hypothetical protein DI547_04835 [Sphingobium sp.]|nr:MAG: hypothetical protein DI547_04835 [Sphingobium sp.]